jgi:lysyl-tRNA synthetase class II
MENSVYERHTFDLADEWTEIDYAQSIKDHLQIDIETSSDEDMHKVLLTHKVHLDGAINRNRLVDNCWKLVRKTIVLKRLPNTTINTVNYPCENSL